MERDSAADQFFDTEISGYNTPVEKKRAEVCLGKFNEQWKIGDSFMYYGAIGIIKSLYYVQHVHHWMLTVEWLTFKSRSKKLSMASLLHDAQPLDQEETKELRKAS